MLAPRLMGAGGCLARMCTLAAAVAGAVGDMSKAGRGRMVLRAWRVVERYHGPASLASAHQEECIACSVLEARSSLHLHNPTPFPDQRRWQPHCSSHMQRPPEQHLEVAVLCSSPHSQLQDARQAGGWLKSGPRGAWGFLGFSEGGSLLTRRHRATALRCRPARTTAAMRLNPSMASMLLTGAGAC